MKSLTRSEMKNVKGGGPIIPGCNYGQLCHYLDGGLVRDSYCGNVWKVDHFVCGCVNSTVLCYTGGE